MTLPVMIFAAGFGTRMGALTRGLPKPLIRVAGRALLDRTLDIARAAGAGPIVVNAHYLADRIERHLAGASDVTVVIEAPEILDTGGGLQAARGLLGASPVATMNADAVFRGENPLDVLTRAWRPGKRALLLCVPVERAIGRAGWGDFAISDTGRLTRGGGLVYTGIQIIDTSALDRISERVFSLNAVWDRLAAEGALHGVVYAGQWADVGAPAGIGLAEQLLDGADD